MENKEIIEAYWIYRSRDTGYFCSNCDSGCLLNYESDFYPSTYCPHCGAYMRKGIINEFDWVAGLY